ncbi:sugar kinase [Paenibacillus sp. MMS20-IR301]|uniref:sugar kinase n=1 Tax=Paenibacillus sp. MMS20-IR301 TaxID=2895946 RepID=UPI0028EC751B|nr:sugar kinase [Paenibacillus sp. MMS20-IR301]WNS43176.1 sugar kinase [Paenibacillus sp. MMS20-IR301]
MDVVSLGETMVLFTPEKRGQMRYSRSFSSQIAGAETNTLIGLAKLGHQAGWISRLGNDEFGALVRAAVRGEGVDTGQVIIDGEAPTGLLFKERLNEREVRMYYYRSHSAASRLQPGDIDEAYIAAAKYLYLTGITPALSPSCRESVFHAVEVARRHKVTVVFDPNLRRKLWGEEEARSVLKELVRKSDIVLAGISEGEFLYGTKDCTELAGHLHREGCGTAIIKRGELGAYYSNTLEARYVSSFKVARVVDPVGAGDGFAAGVLSGQLDGLPLEQSVARGCAVGAAVTMVSGDIEGLPDRRALASLLSAAAEDVQR